MPKTTKSSKAKQTIPNSQVNVKPDVELVDLKNSKDRVLAQQVEPETLSLDPVIKKLVGKFIDPLTGELTKLEDTVDLTTETNASKFIPYTYEELEDFGRLGMSKASIAAKCFLSLSTFNRYCEQDPLIEIHLQRGLSDTVAVVSGKMIDLAMSGVDFEAMKFVLKAKGEWQDKPDAKTEISITSTSNTTHNKIDLIMRSQEFINSGIPYSEWPPELLSFNKIVIDGEIINTDDKPK